MSTATKRKLTSIENCTESKTPKLISISFGPSFRKRLKTENAINAIKEFVETNKERDVVTEYINAGGSAKEIVSLMKQFDGKKDLTVANPLLSALECIVFKCNTDLLLIQKNVEEACEQLLCDYQHTLQNMLSSVNSTTSHRKVVLKLFTGMVNLSNGLAKRLLTLFPINVKTMQILTDTRASSAKLRTCFIHYLLSFLVDDNIVLISELLQKKGLMTCIMPGLINDPPDIIVLVLNTLRLKIVENIRISKTHKLHTFNTMVLRALDKLYDYSISAGESTEDHELIANVEETVKNSVHSLLMTLCTSSKIGILFRERGSVAGKSPNQLIFTLLESMPTPWDHPLRSELVTEILKFCPEFMKLIYHSAEPYIQPNISLKWINLINFMEKMIEKQELPSENIDDQKAMSFISSSIFIPQIQKLLREVNEDDVHSHPLIRFHILSLIRCLLLKLKTILRDYTSKYNTKSTFELQVDNFLNKYLVPSPCILKAYKSGLQNAQEDPQESHQLPELDEYLSLAADVLLLYSETSPLNFNQLRIQENIDLTTESKNPDLLFKLAQLTFQIHSPEPGQDQFSFMMNQFLQCYVTGANSEQDGVIQNVLLATGFFDGFEEEIIVWLYCFKNVSSDGASVISNLIVNTLSVLSKKNEKFIKDVTSVSSYEDTDLNVSSIGDAAVFAEEYGSLMDFANDEFETVTILPVKLSPVVPAFLYALKNTKTSNKNETKIVQNFVSSVLVNLLHTQCSCYGLATLIGKYSNSYLTKNLLEYLNYWNIDSEIDSLNSSVIPDAITQRFFSRLMTSKKSQDSIESFFQDLNEMDCISLWNACLFYAIQLRRKQILEKPLISEIISTLAFIGAKLQTQSALCLKLLLTNYIFVNGFSIERSKSNAFTEIVLKTVINFQNHQVALDYCSKFLSPFRLKFMLTILEKIRRNKRIKINCEAYTIDDVIKFIALSGKQATELLSRLVHLPVNILLNEKQTKLSEWFDLMKCLFNEAVSSLEYPLTNEDFNLLIVKMIEILECNVSTDDLDETIISYLSAFPHHVQHLRDEDVENLLKHHPGINKLAVFLIQYRPSCLEALQSKLLPIENHLNDIEGLLDVLNKIDLIGEIDDEILSQVYRSEICDLNKLLDGCPWLEQNKSLILKIIQQFGEKKKCSKLCNILESNWPEYELDVNKYAILRIIFEIALKSETLVELSLAKLNQLLASGDQTDWLCEEILLIVELLENVEFVLKLDVWKEFVKSSLKHGLHSQNALLIRVLRVFCAKVFENGNAAEESSIIFQMTISHSEFIDVMLGDSEMKCDLVELLITLTTLNTSLMASNHVPLLLGAYKATLSKCDQAIFQLLRVYEDNGIRFSDCRPYLWGDAAVTHHSIRTEISVSLKRLPLPGQVLELLDGELIKNTIRYFPLDRSLKPEDSYVAYDHKMYDISFMLPVMSHLLAPESRISVQKFTRTGGLALIICALANQAEDTRMAAYHCLQRFKAHLFGREKEIQLWDRFVSSLQTGVCSNPPEDNTPPRLPCIVTVFLAQMSLVIGEPLHPLYISLTKFLLAKPCFDIATVPNFLALFYSIDEKRRDQQEWILNVIKYGMRCKADWVVSQKCFLFKLLLQYSFSAVSSERINLLILDIITAGLRIPECRQDIVTKYGFLPWISQTIRQTSSRAVLSSIVPMLGLLSSSKNTSNVIFLISQLLHKLRQVPIPDESLVALLSTSTRIHSWSKVKDTSSRTVLVAIIEILGLLSESGRNSSNVICVVTQLLCNLRGVPIRDESLRKTMGIGNSSKSRDNCDNHFVRILRCYLET
ncbi:uncharacterized protein LOC135834787 [Planococcus citri]|uniref:uncharacterized protein LOC135834787 n=1 Tax=Planococcus citri TaxID=170843 RepID=UPI0031F9107A